MVSLVAQVSWARIPTPISVELRRQLVNEPCGPFASTAAVNRCNRLLTACRSQPYTHIISENWLWSTDTRCLSTFRKRDFFRNMDVRCLSRFRRLVKTRSNKS